MTLAALRKSSTSFVAEVSCLDSWKRIPFKLQADISLPNVLGGFHQDPD